MHPSAPKKSASSKPKPDDGVVDRPAVPAAFNKAFMLCCAAPRMPRSRDWNEDFQEAFESPAFDQFTARARDAALRRLLSDFTAACAALCKSIVDSRMVKKSTAEAPLGTIPDQLASSVSTLRTPTGFVSTTTHPMQESTFSLPEAKTAAPIATCSARALGDGRQQQGELSGHPNSFLYDQIFIRLWPNERQARRLLHTSRLIVASPPPGVNVPLSCLVSYCGVYFTGHALLPISPRSPIVYRGDGLLDTTPCNEIAHIAVRHCLDVANCVVEPVEGQQKLPGLEITAGNDGRLYFTNTVGLLPLAHPEVETSAVRRYESLVIVDVPATITSNRKHATEMGVVWFFRSVATVIEETNEEDRQRQLIAAMRKYGLSASDLGYLAQLVSDEDSLTMEQRASTLNILCVEILARTMKALIFSELTALFMARRIDQLEQVIARALMHFVTDDDRAAKKALLPTACRKFLGGRHLSSTSPLYHGLMLIRSSKRKLIVNRACELAGFKVEWTADGTVVVGARVSAAVITDRVALLCKANAFGTEDELKSIVCPPRLFSFGLPRVIAMQQARGDVREALANANLILADRKQRHGRDAPQYAIAAITVGINQIMNERIDSGVALYKDALALIYKTITDRGWMAEETSILLVAKWSCLLARALLVKGRRAVAIQHLGKAWSLASKVLASNPNVQCGPVLIQILDLSVKCVDKVPGAQYGNSSDDEPGSGALSQSRSPTFGGSTMGNIVGSISPTLSSSGLEQQLSAGVPVPLPTWVTELLTTIHDKFGLQPSCLPALETIAQILLEDDRREDAVPVLKLWVAVTTTAHGEDSEKLIPILETYAATGSSVDFASHFLKSHVALQNAARIARLHMPGGKPDLRLAMALNNLGSLHVLGRMYKVALESLDEARKIFVGLGVDANTPEFVICQRNLAVCRNRRRVAAVIRIQTWYAKWRRRRLRRRLRDGSIMQIPDQHMHLEDAELCESLLSSTRGRGSIVLEDHAASSPAVMATVSPTASDKALLSHNDQQKHQPQLPPMPDARWSEVAQREVAPPAPTAITAHSTTTTTTTEKPPLAKVSQLSQSDHLERSDDRSNPTSMPPPASGSPRKNSVAKDGRPRPLPAPLQALLRQDSSSDVSSSAAATAAAPAKPSPPPSQQHSNAASPRSSLSTSRDVAKAQGDSLNASQAPPPPRGATTTQAGDDETSKTVSNPTPAPPLPLPKADVTSKPATASDTTRKPATPIVPSPPSALRNATVDVAPRPSVVGFMPHTTAAALLQRVGRGFRGRRIVLWAKPAPSPVVLAAAPSPAPRVLDPIVYAFLRALASRRRVQLLRRMDASRQLAKVAQGYLTRKYVCGLLKQRRVASWRAATARLSSLEAENRAKILSDERNASKDIFDQSMTMKRLQRDERQRRLEREERLRKNKQKREELEEDEMGLRHAIVNQATFEGAQLQRSLREKIRLTQQKEKEPAATAGAATSVTPPNVALKRMESRRRNPLRGDLATSSSESGVRPSLTMSILAEYVPRHEGYVMDEAIENLLNMEAQLQQLRAVCSQRLVTLNTQHDLVKQQRMEAQEALDGKTPSAPPPPLPLARQLSGLRGSTSLMPSTSRGSLSESPSGGTTTGVPSMPLIRGSNPTTSLPSTSRGAKPLLASAVSAISIGSYLQRSQRSAASQSRRE